MYREKTERKSTKGEQRSSLNTGFSSFCFSPFPECALMIKYNAKVREKPRLKKIHV